MPWSRAFRSHRWGSWASTPAGQIVWPGLRPAQGSGYAAIQLVIPANPAFVGQTLYTQAVVLYEGLASTRLSNVVASPALR